MPCPDPNVINEALATGVVGDVEGGLLLLQPIVNDGPAETFAMLSALAEVAARQAVAVAPGTFFGIEVDGPDGPGTASIDVLPPSLRFAAQFINACANKDRQMAHALFWALAEPSDRDGTPALAEGVGAVFLMAVQTAREIVAQQRRLREGQ
ncbi:hypothetical protein ACFY0G_17415 [Streptomyces sp. NPDC001552]|uniref:hypothetical protein n=1 Tax=Streptomyces sp. NPDC001552 TaxID=3364587 RepID=UPI0036BC1507